MKILHILDDSVPNISGYSSRSRYIVKSQKKIGLEPYVLTSVRHGESQCDVEEIDNITYFRTNWSQSCLSKLRNIKLLNIVAEMFFLYKRINSTIAAEGADIIHAHSPILCALPALVAARRRKIPFVYEIRALWEDAAVDRGSTGQYSIRYRLTRFFETQLVFCANSIVVICEGLKSELIKRGVATGKIHIIKNGVDVESFFKVPKDRKLSRKLGLQKKIVVGYIGTFYNFEGVKYLIQALQRIFNTYDNVYGLIVGCGEKAEELAAQVKRLNFGDRLIMPGRIPHEDIRSYYSLIDILVYPRESRRITELVTPLKPLEAMAMEKTVLASDVGGLKELVSDGKNGFLFKSCNIDDLEEKLHFLINKSAKRRAIGKKAREWVNKKHNWLDITKNYVNIYEQVNRQNNRL